MGMKYGLKCEKKRAVLWRRERYRKTSRRYTLKERVFELLKNTRIIYNHKMESDPLRENE